MGVSWVSEEGGGVRLHRMTREQEEVCRETASAEVLARATAGICLSFRTDSPWLLMAVTESEGSSRHFFSHDIFCDGRLAGQISNLEKGPDYPLGDYEGRFELGEGMKRLRIVFPWSTCSVIRKIELQDGAAFLPERPESKTLFFGDSITQGYDARFPSASYMNRIAERLQTDGYNKAIGGDRFHPRLAECRESFRPDLIFTAYGTNDWSGLQRREIEENSRAFFHALAVNYPDTPVCALTPVWRKDYHEEKPAGPFGEIGNLIRDAAAPYPNITVIDGFDFVPHDEKYYADRVLHPNDEGMRFYADRLWDAMQNAKKKAGEGKSSAASPWNCCGFS